MALDRDKWSRLDLALFTAVAAVIILYSGNHVFTALAALPLVFLVPGIAVFRIVKRPTVNLPLGEAFVWIIVASMAVSVLGGLFLNVAGGLTRPHWLILVGSIVLVSTLASFFWNSTPSPKRAYNGSISVRNVLLLGVAAVLLVSAVTLAIVSSDSHTEHFAQLWLIPSNTPEHGGAYSAQVGVKNFEGRNIRFVVTVYAGDSDVVLRRSINLNNGNSWMSQLQRPKRTGLRATLMSSEAKGQTLLVTLAPP